MKVPGPGEGKLVTGFEHRHHRHRGTSASGDCRRRRREHRQRHREQRHHRRRGDRVRVRVRGRAVCEFGGGHLVPVDDVGFINHSEEWFEGDRLGGGFVGWCGGAGCPLKGVPGTGLRDERNSAGVSWVTIQEVRLFGSVMAAMTSGPYITASRLGLSLNPSIRRDMGMAISTVSPVFQVRLMLAQ